MNTKREAVDLALRRLVGMPVTADFMLELEGMGWEGDVDALRSSIVDDMPHENPDHLWPPSF